MNYPAGFMGDKKEGKKGRAYRAGKFCPKCGSRLGEHKERMACGKCGYTEFKAKG